MDSIGPSPSPLIAPSPYTNARPIIVPRAPSAQALRNVLTAIIIDPMLATAGSMIATISLLKHRGCKDIRALVLVAAPEGIAALDNAHPNVRCWTAAVDSHLNEVGYIIPGLGDAGDKIFGTRQEE